MESAVEVAEELGYTLETVASIDSKTTVYIMKGTTYGMENCRFDLMERDEVVTHIAITLNPVTAEEKKTAREVYDSYEKEWLGEYGIPRVDPSGLSWLSDEGKASVYLSDEDGSVVIRAFLF